MTFERLDRKSLEDQDPSCIQNLITTFIVIAMQHM